MKWLSLLVALGVAVNTEGSVSLYNDPTIDDVGQLATTLENELKDLDADLSATLTPLAVNDERLIDIRDSFKPAINMLNSQQDSLIEHYRAQVKAIRHRLDDAVVGESAAKALATSTQTTVTVILDKINGTGAGTIEKDNDQQDTLLSTLKQELDVTKSDFFSNLQSVLSTLSPLQGDATDAITDLDDFVDSRKCEYGTTSIESGSAAKWISFKTNFTVKPEVVLTLTGFVAELADSSSKGHSQAFYTMGITTLRSEKHFFDVGTNGFSLVVDPLKDNEAALKTVHCSWMACQNL